MGNNPSHFKGPKNPVETVGWGDCQQFLDKLNAKLGPGGGKFQLPTEAQWEYACRAGTTTPFHFGNSLNGREANCNGNYPYGTGEKGPDLRRTTTVGSYVPNGFGLYDMHGNLWEWCQDWWDDGYYAGSPTDDPTGPATGSYRVHRGGCWCDFAGGLPVGEPLQGVRRGPGPPPGLPRSPGSGGQVTGYWPSVQPSQLVSNHACSAASAFAASPKRPERFPAHRRQVGPPASVLVGFDVGCPHNGGAAQCRKIQVLAVNAPDSPAGRDDELHGNHHHFGRRKMFGAAVH